MLALLALLAHLSLAAPDSTGGADDMPVIVKAIGRTAHGIQVTFMVDNRVGAERIFVHLDPDLTDPREAMYIPPDPSNRKKRDRFTFFLPTHGSPRVQATLQFDFSPARDKVVLVAGEDATPYRQGAATVDLATAESLEATPAPTPLPTEAPPSGPATTEPPGTDAAGVRVMAAYHPPTLTLGTRVVLKDGLPGPTGKGWSRIYTELPDVSLDSIQKAIEAPHQVWGGSGHYVYLLRTSAATALAVEVAAGEIVTAKVLTRAAFEHFVGPGTPYPRKAYAAP